MTVFMRPMKVEVSMVESEGMFLGPRIVATHKIDYI